MLASHSPIKHIYCMRKTNNSLSVVLLVITFAGCATRDNTDFMFFHIQTGLLAEETAETIESAIALEQSNQIEAISHGDYDLLEGVILKREETFSLRADSSTLLSALNTASATAELSCRSLSAYTLLLSELTASNDLAFALNSSLEPHFGVFASVIGILVEQGRLEYDSERIHQAMLDASPAVDSISTAMAALITGTANSVQASYADIAARIQRDLLTEGFPVEYVEELFLLNGVVSDLLGRLEALHYGWTVIPIIHDELMLSLEPRDLRL